MKQEATFDYILANTYECAQRCASINGIKQGWKYLYSVMHIYGTYGATVLVCNSAKNREDYDFFIMQLRSRNTEIVEEPYTRELI